MKVTQELWVRSQGGEDSLEQKWQPAPVFLPGKSQGQRNLVGYSPWGRKESDTTTQLSTHCCGCCSLSRVQLFATPWTAAGTDYTANINRKLSHTTTQSPFKQPYCSQGKAQTQTPQHGMWVNRSVASNSLRPCGLQPARLLSMEFSRQEYWSGLPFPSPRSLPDLGIKSRSLVLQADSLPSEPPGKPQGDTVNLNPDLSSYFHYTSAST